VLTYSYRQYHNSSLEGLEFTGPPQLEWMTYTDQTVFQTIGKTTNGSQSIKQGVEFEFSTKRIRPLATKLIVSGAYFHTRNKNNDPQYIQVPFVGSNGERYPYIGLYEQADNMYFERCNTNFLLDTQIPRLGLIFSTSLQCMWFTGQQTEWCNPWPVSYLDLDMKQHPFTEESAADPVLKHLIQDNASDVAYLYRHVPFSMYVNLKISKRLYKERLILSLFVDRLFDYSPSYRDETGGLHRRNSSPYFGMELNFKL